MLRAASQGLSPALPTVTRATLPWILVRRTKSFISVARVDKASPSATAQRRDGEDPYPMLGRTVGYTAPTSLGQSKSAPSLSFSNTVGRGRVSKPPFAKSGIGSKKTQSKERYNLNRRIRSLRSLPPRFLHARIDKYRSRPSWLANQTTIVQTDLPKHSVFRGQSGTVGPTSRVLCVTEPLLQAIDAASIAHNVPSPSPVIARHLSNISKGTVLQSVWDSYLDLLRLQKTHPIVEEIFPSSLIPARMLWRLCHFIIRSRPVTPSHFPSLLILLQQLWDMGRKPHLSEWNSLINLAAKGQRGRGVEGFRRSLAVLNDCVQNRRPGTSLGEKVDISCLLDPNSINQPDIYTLSILVNVACDTLDTQHLRDAMFLLKESGLAPTRVTQLSLLKFYAKKRQLSGVRGVLRKLHEDRMDLGVDGVNACLWAYALNDQPQISLDMYRVLRDTVKPDPDPQTIAQLRDHLEAHEHIHIPPHAKLDHRTYIVLIQTMAYHGNFPDTFTIFAEFLESGPRGRLSPSTSPAFRAVFMGFSKFAVGRLEESINPDNPHNHWNLANLKRIYRLFLKLPPDVVPSRATIYWILVAFDKTSDHDILLLRDLWIELEERYTPTAPWLFKQSRLKRIKAILFPKNQV